MASIEPEMMDVREMASTTLDTAMAMGDRVSGFSNFVSCPKGGGTSGTLVQSVFDSNAICLEGGIIACRWVEVVLDPEARFWGPR